MIPQAVGNSTRFGCSFSFSRIRYRTKKTDSSAALAVPALVPMAPIGLVRLSLIAVLVGLVTGFGAVFFRDLIGLVHNAGFLGSLSNHYAARAFTPPSHWGALVILLPVLGAVVLTFLVNNYAPCARHTLVGVMMYGFYRAFGHYFIEGVGYATMQRAQQLDATGQTGSRVAPATDSAFARSKILQSTLR